MSMSQRKISSKKICAVILAVYAVCAVLFLVIARDQIIYTSDETYQLANSAQRDLGELTDGMEILQTSTLR